MRKPPKDKTESMHHTVPKFYLKGFRDDNGHIIIWNRNNGTLRRKALKYTSASAGYYTVLDKQKNESDMVEVFYGRIESDAKPIIERMTCAFPQIPSFNSEERTAMSIYLATQFVRTKQNRRKSQLLNDYAYKLQKIVSLSNQRKPLSKEQTSFVRNPHAIGELKLPQDIFILRELKFSNEFIPLFYCRQWTIITFDKPRLITSDTPIALLSANEQHPVGLANAPEYWFPLDNKHLLILSEPLCPYAFKLSSVIDYADIEKYYFGGPSLYDMANSLQLQNCCMEAYGKKELLKKYEGFSLPTRKPFTTNTNTMLDSYYASNSLCWEPVPGHDITELTI